MKVSFQAWFFIAAIVLGTVGHCSAAAGVGGLRCEYLNDPLGIDVVKPRLSWLIQSDERGQRQTAYQAIVASTPELLANDQGDLWDSGRVASDQTIHVEYAGKPLASKQRCHWKVRVWDKNGQASAWSKPALWTMGLLKPSDWEAQWIAAPTFFTENKKPHNGFHSQFAPTANTKKWIAIDLGQVREIDAVQLHPARPYDYQPDTPGFLFPLRFKIETALKSDFSDAKIVVDRTETDVPNPGEDAPIFRFEPTSARYVRLTVVRMNLRESVNFGVALAEMRVFAGADNVAKNGTVTVSDTIEMGGWGKDRVVDGRLLPEKGAQALEPPSTMLRKEFEIRGPIKRATVSATGLGLYELSLNGRRVGDRFLTPEWTCYDHRIQYQTYDVTEMLRAGKNAVGAMLGGGWWTGPLFQAPSMENPQLYFLMRMDIELADGTTQTVVTDPTWRVTADGPIRRSGIYFGETYDATKEMHGWDQPGFSAAGWSPAMATKPKAAEKALLVAQLNEPIHVVQELRPVKISEPKPGVYIFDMGQNMVGWCRLTADAPLGTKIVMRHGEMLRDDGTLFTDNLGGAQIDTITWPGGRTSFEPHFTYHGFRYVEITGLPNRPDADAIVGRVFHSDAPEKGRFESSNQLLGRIMHCIDWVQRGNMHSVPTDCPQRTERMGWMGDIQAFAQTAIFNRDMAAFLGKWIVDVRDSQADDGRYPDFAPHVGIPNKLEFLGVPAWGDAGTVVPWRIYQNYADTRMLEQHFDSARRWVDFIQRNNPNLLWQKSRGNDYNDWLNGDTLEMQEFPAKTGTIPNEVFATAFFALSADNVAKMAKALSRTEDAAKYRKLFEDIKAAFNREYVSASDGRIKGDTQAGYALALHFNLLDQSLRAKAAERLIEAIRKYKDHPSTGIQTTHRLMLELSRNGYHDEACRLINLRTVPSWGYMVEMGATTIWERWDGYVEGRGIKNSGMNSFNHWAFGAVGEWVWRELAGINPDDEQPGFKHFLIRPRPGPGFEWVKARYDSIRGPIASGWKVKDGTFSLDVVIPANTTATVYVPAKNAEAVTEGSIPATEAVGVKFQRMENGAAVFSVESGSYSFVARK